ncbi:hypothetical protein CLV46_1462 [Diaminobutyricimonas aerilata]|uniref:DUF2231 domain-containing protein n=1 Tax=Diaminobutyricimonas aerilata TaxID=1162967 RepID=A0A2M9CJ28_9MICO|nr:DUF2231 domain-containing protein [Diaminobutyricimonas aerilata]PJJ71906.1 hypothetical protein CLV46_1462 [Diaminobutyricimonas aerilata]
MEINGLPLHPLVVHATVIFVPLAALLVSVSAVWPAARRRLGFLTPLTALVALVLVPITVAAGQWLIARVPQAPLIGEHASIGRNLLPWSIAVFVIAVALWVRDLLERRRQRGTEPGAERPNSRELRRRPAGTAITVALAALALVASAGSVVQVYLIGESGSRAVWEGGVADEPLEG